MQALMEETRAHCKEFFEVVEGGREGGQERPVWRRAFFGSGVCKCLPFAWSARLASVAAVPGGARAAAARGLTWRKMEVLPIPHPPPAQSASVSSLPVPVRSDSAARWAKVAQGCP